MINLTNNANIDPTLAVWLLTDDYDFNPDPNTLSVTTLLKPARMVALQRSPQYTVNMDISTLVKSRIGQAIHSGIENAWLNNYQQAMKILGYSQDYIDRVVINPKGQLKDGDIPVYIEHRGTKDFGEYKVTGKFDFAFNGQLQDTKSTSVYSFIKGNMNEKYIQQGSCYRNICSDILTEDTIKINFVFTDHKTAMVGTTGYPPTSAYTSVLPLYSQSKTEEFIDGRLGAIDDALSCGEQSELPECSYEDLWMRPAVFKYFKNPKNKRATKSSEDYQEIKALYEADGSIGKIEVVESVAMRCEYCSVKEICEQYKAM